jgi:hypothetical protein
MFLNDNSRGFFWIIVSWKFIPHLILFANTFIGQSILCAMEIFLVRFFKIKYDYYSGSGLGSYAPG